MPTTSTLDLYRIDPLRQLGRSQIRCILEDHGVDQGLKDWIFHVIDRTHNKGFEEGYNVGHRDGYREAEADRL